MSHSSPDTTHTCGGNGHLTNHTYQGIQIADTPTTQHYLGNQIQNITSEAFIIEGHPGQVIGCLSYL